MDSNVDFGADDASEKASAGQRGASRVALKSGVVALVLRMLAVHAAAGVELKTSCERIAAHISDSDANSLAVANTFVNAIATAKDSVTLLDLADRYNATLSITQKAMLTVSIGELRDPALRAAAFSVIVSEFPILQDDLR